MDKIKTLILFTILMSNTAFALGHEGGGAQGVYDLKSGKIAFLDILTPKQIAQLKIAKTPLDYIFSHNECTNEFSRNLDLDPYDYNRMASANKYSPEELFADEQIKAKKLLKKTLKLKPHYGEFLSTKFIIPQTKDATQVSRKFQIQLAYHYNRQIYIQQQTAEMLLAGHLTGVFIKEHLRAYNSYYELDLTNKQLEVATFHIYRENYIEFKKTQFYKKTKDFKALEDHFNESPRV